MRLTRWRCQVERNEALIACYRSGQISEAQWQAHLRDPGFAAYVQQRNAKR